MSVQPQALRIVHLFPRELGINGDVGNVTVLARRARAYGVATEVVDVGIGGALPAETDLIHIGSGPLSAAEAVAPEVARHAPALRRLAGSGVPVLAIAAGWELLGRTVQTYDGRVLTGAGVFPSVARRTGAQAVNETVLLGADGTIVAGFANHDSVVELDADAQPLGRVLRGFGNGGAAAPSSGTEGIVIGAAIGSHLHGTLLALNPGLADRLLAAAVGRRWPGRTLQRPSGEQGGWLDRVDEWSRRAREAIVARTGASVTP